MKVAEAVGLVSAMKLQVAEACSGLRYLFSLLVLGFIADDLRRAEMSRTWGAPKPYFEPTAGGAIALRNVPVPAPPDPADTLDFWQRAFGWSVALETFLEMKGWRYEWVVDHHRVLPPGKTK